MALNIKTDKEFDQALAWLSTAEGKSKSEFIRSLVIYWYGIKRKGFEFGALKGSLKQPLNSEEILKGLKGIDQDQT